jgi:predicted TIM-barrel fold metal-dependent hydrolase
MIVDVHTHLLKYDDISLQCRDDMQRCGINPSSWDYSPRDYLNGTEVADKVIVFGLSASATGWNGDDSYIAEFVKCNPKYIFFASIDPLQPDFMERLRYAHTRLHCKGLKLGAVYQGLHPHDKRYYEIYAYSEKNNLPVMTHSAATFSSGTPLEFARPALMEQVAVHFPGLKIVLAHLGHPWIGETVAAIRKQRNLYADISALYYRPWQFYNAMLTVQEYMAQGKVLFGSDFPAATTKSSIEGLKNVNKPFENAGLPLVSKEVTDTILEQNSLEILEIL